MESPALAGLSVWNDKTQRLRCVSVTAETVNVRTFVFQSETPGYFEYQAGQFVTLVLPKPGGRLLRTYTLSSSPSRPHSVSITAKAQPGSEGTRWMFDHVTPGTLLAASGPYGSFTIGKTRRRKLLFISAGSGITPFVSMTRYLADCHPDSDVSFVSCAQSPDDVLFDAELGLLQRSMTALKVAFVVERGGDRLRFPLSGRLDAAKLSSLVDDAREREVFCCGPPRFMTHVQVLLEQIGFDMRHYHEESFGSAEPAQLGSSAQAATPMVRFRQTGAALAAQPGETLLHTARRGGVPLDSSCESGICGACMVAKLSGEVAMSHRGGIADDEVAAGLVLACCSRPLTDVELDA